MADQRLGIEAQILGVNADHFEGFHALGHAGHVAEFNRLDMIGVDAGGLANVLQAQAALFALALQKPARLAGGIDLAIGLLAEKAIGYFQGLILIERVGKLITHHNTLGLVTVNRPLMLILPENDPEWLAPD